HVRAFAWSDANTVVYMADEGVTSAIGEIRRDGTAARPVMPTGGPVVVAMDRASNGTVALLAHTPAHPAEVYLLAPGATAPKRLTDNNPWLATMRWAKQEVVSFKARDGVAMEGILVRPLDEVA